MGTMGFKKKIILEEKNIDLKFKDYVDDQIYQITQRFLKNKLKTGNRTMETYRSAFTRFFEFIYITIEKIITLESIKLATIEQYLNYLDKRLSKHNSKLNQLKYIYSLFDYISDDYRKQQKTFYNPVPKAKYFKFTIELALTDKEQQEKVKDQIFTIDQLSEILMKSKQVDYEKYIQLVLLTFCGMRVSEVVSIQKLDVNIDKRYLITGKVENCRKSNRLGKNDLYFSYPNKVADTLFDYLQYHEKKYGNNIWLFPDHHNRNSYTSPRTLQRFINSLNVNWKNRTHKFRKTFETYQTYKSTNAPLHIVELLSNHQISSVVFRHYAYCKIEDRVMYYDQYFPKEYIQLLDVI